MNIRTLKKNIRYACSDVAEMCILATRRLPDVDHKSFNDLILETARLQTSSLKRVSVAFDKSPKDFASRNLYNKARRQYYAEAYRSLENDFNKQLQDIVNQTNKNLPTKEQQENNL